jgi:hypothetical protein
MKSKLVIRIIRINKTTNFKKFNKIMIINFN